MGHQMATKIYQKTWGELITVFGSIGKEPTIARKCQEFRQARWKALEGKPIGETKGMDFIELLNAGGAMTAVYLHALQNMALECGDIYRPILAKKWWPKHEKVKKRAITWEEHCRLSQNVSRRSWKWYLTILWETGAAQADAADFRLDFIKDGVMTYSRAKNGRRAAFKLSKVMLQVVQEAAGGRTSGFILPTIQREGTNCRATVFRNLCRRLGIQGVTLHSYRYAWAVRAFEMGIPERLAMVGLGHNSSAVHHAYASGARLVAPALE